MVNIIDDLLDRSALEALITRFGDKDLAQALAKGRDLRRHLEMTFADDQRNLYLDAEDARSDASGLREEAVLQIAVALGAGIGAAIALRPALAPDRALQFGAAIAGAVIAIDEPLYTDQHELAWGVSAAVSQVMGVLGRKKAGGFSPAAGPAGEE